MFTQALFAPPVPAKTPAWAGLINRVRVPLEKNWLVAVERSVLASILASESGVHHTAVELITDSIPATDTVESSGWYPNWTWRGSQGLDSSSSGTTSVYLAGLPWVA